MKKITRLTTTMLIVNILVLPLLYSCSDNSQSTASLTPTISAVYTPITHYPDWLMNWLIKPLCQPPCWRGITPGKSTYVQALGALDRDSYVLSTSASRQGIEWYFGPKVGDGQGFAATIDLFRAIDSSNKYATPDPNIIIQEISIYPPQGIVLYPSDIIGIYGEPEKVLFHDWNAGTVSVDLLYPKIGMVVAFALQDQYEDPYNVKSTITPKAEIWKILFYESGLNFFMSETAVQEPIIEFDWKGYGTYP